jgi:hypothetical protein
MKMAFGIAIISQDRFLGSYFHLQRDKCLLKATNKTSLLNQCKNDSAAKAGYVIRYDIVDYT